MKSIKIFTLTIASLLISLSGVSVVHAQSGQSVSDEAGEVVSAEEREKIWDKVRGGKDRHDDDDQDDESDLDDESDGEEGDEGYGGKSEMDRAEKRDKTRSKAEGAKTKGNEKSQEMRARRDERKAIMEEHKSGQKSGEHGESDRPDKMAKKNGDINADDTNAEIDEEAKKPKKPWWRFWGE